MSGLSSTSIEGANPIDIFSEIHMAPTEDFILQAKSVCGDHFLYIKETNPLSRQSATCTDPVSLFPQISELSLVQSSDEVDTNAISVLLRDITPDVRRLTIVQGSLGSIRAVLTLLNGDTNYRQSSKWDFRGQDV
ncbi:hypothetical protein ABKN59_004820 [Abortiporus biennis]